MLHRDVTITGFKEGNVTTASLFENDRHCVQTFVRACVRPSVLGNRMKTMALVAIEGLECRK